MGAAKKEGSLVPGDAREQVLRKYKTKRFEAYGAVMKECVMVPDARLNETAELATYHKVSYEYAVL